MQATKERRRSMSALEMLRDASARVQRLLDALWDNDIAFALTICDDLAAELRNAVAQEVHARALDAERRAA